MAGIKRQRQLAEKRSKAGVLLGQDDAATRIQAAARGFIWRRRIRRDADAELIFIGMRPKVLTCFMPYASPCLLCAVC